MAKRKRKPTVTQTIMTEVFAKTKNIPNDVTRRVYNRSAKKFVDYCRATHDVRTYDECKVHLQDYANSLVERGYSAYTIHTYLAGACKAFDLKIGDIDKPKRRISEIYRGRDNAPLTTSSDMNHPKWQYLIEFQRRVGIRRTELMKLTGKDFLHEDGKYYVFVKRGKGGKQQKQYIRPEDAAFVKSYFDIVGPNERVFAPELFNNTLNLHKLRADAAKQIYFEIIEKLRKTPEFSKELERDIIERWQKCKINKRTGKPPPFPYSEIQGFYTLRGENRKNAIKRGMPTSYLKLAVMWVSMFKLSHFRNDVTVQNYLLA